MKKLNFLVSLTNNDNDYQQEQAAAAEKAARRLGVDVKIIHANNDAVAQSQQLLHYVQDSAVVRPDAIMFEPAGGTAFPQVARAAAAAGIGWVVLNHEVDYVLELRRTFKVPIFSISSDHEEVGKIQGKQFAALLPNGGSILYIEGPAPQVVSVFSDGHIMLGKQPVSLDELTKQLSDAHGQYRKLSVVVRGDRNTTHGRMTDV